MKENFPKIFKPKKEDSLGDYKPVLDDLIFEGEKREFQSGKETLTNQIKEIKKDPNIASYFEKEANVAEIEKDIEIYETKIINAINNPNSPISKETLDKMIMQLRGYEYVLKTNKQELSARYNNDINIRVAITKITSLEEKINQLNSKLKKIVEKYLETEDTTKEELTIGLN